MEQLHKLATFSGSRANENLPPIYDMMDNELVGIDQEVI